MQGNSVLTSCLYTAQFHVTVWKHLGNTCKINMRCQVTLENNSGLYRFLLLASDSVLLGIYIPCCHALNCALIHSKQRLVFCNDSEDSNSWPMALRPPCAKLRCGACLKCSWRRKASVLPARFAR